MTRHYFTLLSVRPLSVKPVLHPEEIWGHRFQLGILEAGLWAELKMCYSGLKCVLFILNLEIYKKKSSLDHFWRHFLGAIFDIILGLVATL